MMLNLWVVINRHYPDLYQQLAELPDYRERPRYQVRELIMSGLVLFLFRLKSRNNADSHAKNQDYSDNVKRVFGINVADMDTVNTYLKQLSPEYLENVKNGMFRSLILSKTLHKWRYDNKYHMLAIDGSGMQSYDYEPYPGCPFKEFKSGKKAWTTYVLEAKIVTSNGFALSLMTEWVENPVNKSFNKQDSEHKAFVRLIERLKKEFPRLPVMLLLDGLYPNNTVFSIAKENGYTFAITLKDKSLKSVQEQISDMNLFKEYEKKSIKTIEGQYFITQEYTIFGNVKYKNKDEHYCVFETIKTEEHKQNGQKKVTRFVHITNIDVSTDNIHKVSLAARLRWKIENEGFNIQKNTDYHLAHKYSRTSFTAVKNYYQLLQIAEMINQLVYRLRKISIWLDKFGLTRMSLFTTVLSFFIAKEFSDEELAKEKQKMIHEQLRY